MSLYRACNSKHVVFFVRVTRSELEEAIENTLIHVTSHQPTRRSEKSQVPSCPTEGLGKTPSMLLRVSRGRLRLGFNLFQRDTPAITVGPDTLLQGDDARGP
jgi:hypothetical protein